MYVYNKSSNNHRTQRFQPPQDRLSFHLRNYRRWRLERAMQRYDNTSSRDRTYFSDDRTPFYKDVSRQIPDTDVINLHWVSEFLDYGAFFEWLPEELPVIWTLHDMSPFTGGCCYDLECGKFRQNCGTCPQLGSLDQSDFTHAAWKRKAKYYGSLALERFHVVTPSSWLRNELKRSSLLSRFPDSVIPYGLDLEAFRPRDRRIAREILGIPHDMRVLLFVSQDISTPRKGFPILAKALEGMQSDNIFLLSLGIGHSTEVQRFPHLHIPSVNHDGLLSLIYSAADVFVLPSLADNLPNTMLESMACGTPVVAFATGGIPEGVRPGVTGLLAKTGDAKELRSAILGLLGNEALRSEMAANCRKIALAEYSLKLQAERYTELYESMLTSSKAKRAR